MVFGIINPLCEYSMASLWKKLPAINTFHVNIRDSSVFSCLLSPDWSIQSLGAPAIYKVVIANKSICLESPQVHPAM